MNEVPLYRRTMDQLDPAYSATRFEARCVVDPNPEHLPPRTSSGSIPWSQTPRGITYTDHSPGNGTGQAKRRILFDEFSNQ